MHIPKLEFWITTDAIWPVGSFLVALWLGWVGIRQLMSRVHVSIIVTLIVILSAIGWWSSANQSERSAAEDAQLKNASSALPELKAQISDLHQQIGQLTVQNQQLIQDDATLSIEEKTRQSDITSFMGRQTNMQTGDLDLGLHPEITMVADSAYITTQNVGKTSLTLQSERFNNGRELKYDTTITIPPESAWRIPIKPLNDMILGAVGNDKFVPYTMTIANEKGHRFLASYMVMLAKSGEEPRLHIRMVSINELPALPHPN